MPWGEHRDCGRPAGRAARVHQPGRAAGAVAPVRVRGPGRAGGRRPARPRRAPGRDGAGPAAGGSRQPVREALHRLEAEGWVDLRPNQGAFVHVPTDHEVDELLDVRELLEVQMARLAAGAASPGGVARLRAIWHDGQSAVASGETERIVAANNEFHAALARVAGNTVLADLARIVSRRVRWYYRQVAPLRGQESWAEHRELIDAVEAGDQERAAEIARQHTEGTRSAYHQPPKASLG